MMRIFLWHLLAALAGAGVMVAYFGYKVATLPPEKALAGIAIIVVGFVFAAGWTMLCTASCAVCMLIAWLKNRKRQG